MEEFSPETAEKLKKYYDLLVKWQQSINLVGPKTIDIAWERHFLDSAQLVKHIPEGTEGIADIGSGAGFPGMVMAMMRPDLDIVLIDSDAKKCEFMETVARETNTRARVMCNRIEKLYGLVRVNLVTARGLANVMRLARFMEGLGSTEGLFLKGKMYKEELEMAEDEYEIEHTAYKSSLSHGGVILRVSLVDPVYSK